MTKITDILARVARQVSYNEPSSWITATDRTAKEIRDDFLLETVDELQKRIDWASPIGKQTTITGDGSTVSHSLPSNFVRVQFDENAIYEITSTRRAGVVVQSDGDWTHINAIGTGGGSRFYQIEGYEGNYTIQFYPTLEDGSTVTVSYISNVWMADSGGTEGKALTDPDDVALYPRRILELGCIWRFRKRKGVPYQDILSEYEAWLATQANQQRGMKRIVFGEPIGHYHPMRVPVPDYIPDS